MLDSSKSLSWDGGIPYAYTTPVELSPKQDMQCYKTKEFLQDSASIFVLKIYKKIRFLTS